MADLTGMPTSDELPDRLTHGRPVDPRTGRPAGEWTPLTDEDRRLQRIAERERWIGAISVPPPVEPNTS